MIAGEVHYRRSRFSTRLLEDRLYTAGHSWLEREDGDLWRIGFTKFATRMLGEIVEHDFEIKADTPIDVGQVIGWIEGFKAASDLYCVAQGTFLGGNPLLDENVDLVGTDPYGEGWLYVVAGKPEPDAVDVLGYESLLDSTIDTMLGDEDKE